MNRFNKWSIPNLFILISIFGLVLVLGMGWTLTNQIIPRLSPSLNGVFYQVPNAAIMRAFEMEIPYLQVSMYNPEDPPKPFSLFLFETLTNLEPTELASPFKQELPGFSGFHPSQALAVKSKPIGPFAMESPPPPAITETPGNTAEEKPATPPLSEERMVLIYNTHNTESWSYASDNPDITNDTKNISLVSKKLAEELDNRGMKAKFDPTDHQKLLKQNGLPYAFSYAQSLKTVKTALKQDKTIDYIFDIHRDSFPKKMTTATIGGKSYAQILFVIGKGNEHWKKNDEFAKKINALLNEKYPGLSKGIDYKGTAEGNGEYNQSVSPHSLLVEIGGIENTLEECYNTAAALSDVLADIYFEKDKKATKPSGTDKNEM